VERRLADEIEPKECGHRWLNIDVANLDSFRIGDDAPGSCEAAILNPNGAQ
jgi:hypothetical protein